MATGVVGAAERAGWEVHAAVHPNAVGVLAGLLPPPRIHATPKPAQAAAAVMRQVGATRALLTRRAHSALFAARLAGLPAWGYRGSGRGLLLRAHIPFCPLSHRVQNHHNLAAAAGIPVPPDEPLRLVATSPPPPGLPPDPLVLNPHASWPEKMWGVDTWQHLAPALAEATGARPVVLGGPGDEERTSAIAASCGGLDLGGKTDIPALKAVLAAARLVVTHDSGPMHMAVALGTPVVAVFGATSPELVGPWPVGTHHTLAPPRAIAPPPPSDRRHRWIDDIPWRAVVPAAVEAWG